jgi:hypothetical protein
MILHKISIMTKDINEMWLILKSLLKNHENVFNIVSDSEEKFEVIGTKAVMQGKQKVEGHYFATLIPKPKDLRFYFFPAYTHADEIKALMNETLTKFLKGKSCFHIKKVDDAVIENLKVIIDKGVDLYQKDGLL